ncbi:MAG: Subunit of CoA-transferase of family III [Candidatus Peregrinibacteria bacterium GW2011_GWA2_54_9]|nr:MAG: Subunit of CoA-transferase of family III [Candidatus Peregrinibacteria bacterium GW2011_GWA2_54_9]
MNAGVLALDGVKIVEFGGYAAGPHVGKMLANFGATVVHVESMSRPDGFRMQYPPYKDDKPGINSGGCFTYFNDSKYGVTIDLKNPEGRKLARKLADWCDIVIENMRPGVIDRLGLGFEELRKSNPGLIMLSTCNMGQTGPASRATMAMHIAGADIHFMTQGLNEQVMTFMIDRAHVAEVRGKLHRLCIEMDDAEYERFLEPLRRALEDSPAPATTSV